MSAVISNQNLGISSFKIIPDIIEGFSMLTINNKYAKSMSILQFLFKVSINSIETPSYFFLLRSEKFR